MLSLTNNTELQNYKPVMAKDNLSHSFIFRSLPFAWILTAFACQRHSRLVSPRLRVFSLSFRLLDDKKWCLYHDCNDNKNDRNHKWLSEIQRQKVLPEIVACEPSQKEREYESHCKRYWVRHLFDTITSLWLFIIIPSFVFFGVHAWEQPPLVLAFELFDQPPLFGSLFLPLEEPIHLRVGDYIVSGDVFMYL